MDIVRAAVVAKLRVGTAADQPAAGAGAAVGAGAATAGALWDASRAGDLAEIARLLDAGAEPDAFISARVAPHDVVMDDGTAFQGTALLGAALCGQLDAVRLLLDRGADPCLLDCDGFAPLMGAARYGHAGVLRELVARGADLDAAQLESGATAFHFACLRNQPECVAALVELGCDTTIKAANGMTGKQVVVQQGHGAVLDVLRTAVAARLRAGEAVDQPAAAAGATVWHQTATALYQASQPGDLAEMARLLDAGAEPDALVAAITLSGDVVRSTALVQAAHRGQLRRGPSAIVPLQQSPLYGESL
jgi:hypothetical protein